MNPIGYGHPPQCYGYLPQGMHPAQGIPPQGYLIAPPAHAAPPKKIDPPCKLLVRRLSREDLTLEGEDRNKPLGDRGGSGYVTKASLDPSERYGEARNVVAKKAHRPTGHRIDVTGVTLLQAIPELRNHPNIVYIYGYESGGKRPLIMERCSHTLSEPSNLSGNQKRSFGKQCVNVVFDMLEHNIRQNDLHRKNVMIAEDQKTLKIIDLGLMTQNDGSFGLVDYQMVLGTAAKAEQGIKISKRNSPINVIQRLLHDALPDEISENFNETCKAIRDSDEKIADIELLKYKLWKGTPIDAVEIHDSVVSLGNEMIKGAYLAFKRNNTSKNAQKFYHLLHQEQVKHANNVKQKFSQIHQMLQGEGAMQSLGASKPEAKEESDSEADSEEEKYRAAFARLRVPSGAEAKPSEAESDSEKGEKVIMRCTNGTVTRGGPKTKPKKRGFKFW